MLGDYDEDMDFSNMSMEEMLEFMKRMKGLSSPMKMRAGGKFVADGRILDAIEFIESGGDPEAINKRTGAAGAYQILDSTALNPGYGVTPISLEDRFDKKKARKFAKEYLEGIAKANPNFTTDQLIQSYHSGPKNVAEGNIGPEGKKYLTKFYGAMNQKPGGLESFLTKTGLMSTAEAANEGETKKDDRSFMQKLLDPFGLANPNVPPLPFDRKNLKNYPIDPGLRKFLRSRNVTDENFVDDPVEFDMSLDASDLSLSDLDALQKAGGLPSQAKTIAGAGRVTKKDDEKDKVEKEKEKDQSGEGRLYDKELTGISGDRSDLESDILKLQRQLEKDRDVDKWLSIAKAGLAIADPTKTLSEAAETGIDAMTEARKRYSDGVIDLINARAKLAKAVKKGLNLSELFTNLDRIEKGILTFSEMGATPDPDKVKELNARKEQILQLIAKFPGYDVFKPIVDPKKQKTS